MRKKIELLGLVMVMVCGLMVALNGQASATAGTSHGFKYVSGVGLPDVRGVCNTRANQMPDKFKDYFSIPPMVMTGDLQGCWYTKARKLIPLRSSTSRMAGTSSAGGRSSSTTTRAGAGSRRPTPSRGNMTRTATKSKGSANTRSFMAVVGAD